MPRDTVAPYTVMVGNRMTREYEPAPTPPAKTILQTIGDTIGAVAGFGAPMAGIRPDVVLDRNGRPLGDALTDAQSAARAKVNAEAATYTLASVPATRSEAIMALILLMHSARQENPANQAQYKKVIAEAAYTYRNAAPIDIVKAALFQLGSSTPRTRQVATNLRDAMTTAPVAPTLSRARRRAPEADVPVPVIDSSPTPWYNSLPDWALPVGGAVAVGLTALVLWPRRGPA